MRDFKSRFQMFWLPGSGRITLIVCTLVMWAVLGILFIFYGYRDTWRLWGIPAWSEPFLDFRLIPGMVQSLQMGMDPAIENPGDPAGRVFNYPAVWYLLSYTNLSQADTLWIGVALIVLFFLGVFLFPGNLRNVDALLMVLVLFSPAALLLYERANVDLFIFFLCSLAVMAAGSRNGLAAFLLFVASILKLFPFFGMWMFANEEKRKSLRLLSASFVPFAAYLLIIFPSMQTAWTQTQRGMDISYGANVLVIRFTKTLTAILENRIPAEYVTSILTFAPYLIAALVALTAAWLGLARRARFIRSSQRNLDAFRMGAAIYVGTFILGNNWDYRLIFLVFAVPQISEWIRCSDGNQRKLVITLMGLILLSCWYLLYNRHVDDLEYKTLFLLDEFLNWSLFAGLVHLLTASAPEWIKLIFAAASGPVQQVRS